MEANVAVVGLWDGGREKEKLVASEYPLGHLTKEAETTIRNRACGYWRNKNTMKEEATHH